MTAQGSGGPAPDNTPMGPIQSVTRLARRFTADEWRDAAHKAVSYKVEQVCKAMYQFRLADEILAPDKTIQSDA